MPNPDEKIVKLHDLNDRRNAQTSSGTAAPSDTSSSNNLASSPSAADQLSGQSGITHPAAGQSAAGQSAVGQASVGQTAAGQPAMGSSGQGAPSQAASSQNFTAEYGPTNSGSRMNHPMHRSAGPDPYSWGKRAPNILTVLRILAVPVFVFLLTSPSPQSRLWATGIFLAASLTDWLDGYLARIYQSESILGTLLDPLADKVLVTAALVMLASEGGDLRVPAWMVVTILSRDLLVSGLRSMAAVKGTVVAASRAAKHKTAWTMLAIVFLLVNGTYTIFSNEINFHSVGMLLLWLATVLSVFTGLEYAIKLRQMFL